MGNTAYGVINKRGLSQADLDAAIAGISTVSFVHSQPIASSLWTVNHNLGFKPSVSVYTVGGLEFLAEVSHVSDNILTITLTTPTAGFARCT